MGGIGHIRDAEPQQRVGRPSQDAAQLGVDPHEATVRIHFGQADGGAGEDRGEMLLALAQGGLRASPLDRRLDPLSDLPDQVPLARGPGARHCALHGEQADPFLPAEQHDVDEGADLSRPQAGPGLDVEAGIRGHVLDGDDRIVAIGGEQVGTEGRQRVLAHDRVDAVDVLLLDLHQRAADLGVEDATRADALTESTGGHLDDLGRRGQRPEPVAEIEQERLPLLVGAERQVRLDPVVRHRRPIRDTGAGAV